MRRAPSLTEQTPCQCAPEGCVDGHKKGTSPSSSLQTSPLTTSSSCRCVSTVNDVEEFEKADFRHLRREWGGWESVSGGSQNGLIGAWETCLFSLLFFFPPLPFFSQPVTADLFIWGGRAEKAKRIRFCKTQIVARAHMPVWMHEDTYVDRSDMP